jgi:hypothetical protein
MESSLTDLQLAEIDLDALFIHDARGRIVRTNEPDGRPAPRFDFWHTRVGNIWRVGRHVPDNVARRLEELAVSEPVRDDLTSPPVQFEAMHGALGMAFDPESSGYGLGYRFPDAIPDLPDTTRITSDNLHLLRRMVDDMAWPRAALDAGDIWTAVVVDDAAVSICFCSRLTDRAAEAGVETLAGYRGRGYAPTVVAAWARAVRASGRIPFYGTSHDNLASQAVARKLGLIRYAVGFRID